MNRTSQLRPSFFELVATEQLNNGIRPALRFALEVLSPRHRALLWLAHHADEVYLALSAALELASLRRDAATVCESFYSLRRSINYRAGGILPPNAVVSSLIWRVALPYIRVKLDEVHAQLRISRTSAPPLSFRGIPTRLPRLVRILLSLRRIIHSQTTQERYLRWYPRCATVADLSALICKTCYMLEFTPYFSPSLFFQGLILRRLTPTEVLGPPLPPARTNMQTALRVSDGIATTVKYVAFAALVAYRFLEYYHQAEDEVPAEQTPVPPPPQPLRPIGKVPDSPDECALCGEKRVDPAALAASGYVFCYECILKYVRENRRCPVTHLTAERAQIWRVYHAEA